MKRTGSSMRGMVLLGGSVVFLVVAGLVMSFPWQAILFVVAVLVIGVVVNTAMASVIDRRNARYAVAAWADRNVGRSGTSPDAFPASEEWTLQDSPRFSGRILGIGRRDGFEIGIACTDVSEEEGPARYRLRDLVRTNVIDTTRHTAVLVRLPRAHPHVRMKPPRRRRTRVAGLPEPAVRVLAALPPHAELVQIQDRELHIRYFGWPDVLDLDVCVDAGIEVARSLQREDIGEPQGH